MREVLAFCGAVGGWLKAKGKRLWAGLFFYGVAHTRDLDSRFRGRGFGFLFAQTLLGDCARIEKWRRENAKKGYMVMLAFYDER